MRGEGLVPRWGRGWARQSLRWRAGARLVVCSDEDHLGGHRRNESLSLNCFNSSLWSARSAVIARSNPFSLVSVVTVLPTLPETD